MNELLMALSLISSTVFLYLYYKTYAKYFEIRKSAPYFLILLFLATTVPLFNFSWLNDYLHIRLIATMLAYFICFPFIFKTNISNALFLTFNFILKNYCTYLIFASIFAIHAKVSIRLDWLSNSNYYHATYVLSYGLSSVFIVTLDKLLLHNKMTAFFKNRVSPLFLIIIQTITLFILTILVNIETYMQNDYYWYNFLLLFISISLFIVYFLTRLFTANLSYLILYKEKTQFLEQQLSFQINHYNKYEQDIKNFLKLKHDFDKTIHMLDLLYQQKNYEDAQSIIAQSQNESKKINIHYKMYSNNLIIDALINDYAYRFKELSCAFNSFSYIDLNLHMNQLDLMKIFYNILENVLEAITAVENPSHRFVYIKTTRNNNYYIISFENAVNAKTNLRKTTSVKKRISYRGFGLQIIKELVEKYDGFIHYYFDHNLDQKTFKLFLHFPISNT